MSIYFLQNVGILDRNYSHQVFHEAEEVRQGKYLEIELDELDPNKAIIKANDMCEKLLANTVIENYHVEIDE